MAIDSSKLGFSSTWDIDQLIATGEVNIPSVGTHILFTVPPGVPGLPVFEVQFKPSGSNKWFQAGVYATANTTATYDVFDVYMNSGSIYMLSQAGTARYFVWLDRINY